MLRRQREIDQSLADQAYDWLCHNVYIQMGALEEEIASLNRKSSSLDKELFLAERAVQAAERWVAKAEDLVPQGEEALLEKHKELDEATHLLEQVTEETEELERQVEAAVEQGQLPPAVLEQLRWIHRNPEDAEMMGAQALAASALRGAVGHDGDWPQEVKEVSGEQQVEEEQRAAAEEEALVEVLEPRTTADQEEQKMEGCATQEDQPATREDAEEDEDEKHTCGCFRALWNWVWR